MREWTVFAAQCQAFCECFREIRRIVASEDEIIYDVEFPEILAPPVGRPIGWGGPEGDLRVWVKR